MNVTIPSEVKLLGYVAGLYVSFLYWGYLQEKLVSTKFKSDTSTDVFVWDFPFALNFLMGLAAAVVAGAAELISRDSKPVNFFGFARAAITCALGSPIGYAALKYISFPLQILTKSSKPVPLMLIGVLFFKKKYTWYKYLCVFLLCVGCIMFSVGKKMSLDSALDTSLHLPLLQQLYGIFLVGINLFLDGYTNNEQDLIFKEQKITGRQMMKYINIWQCIYLLFYLICIWILYKENSELYNAIQVWYNCSEVRYDIFLFCLCASIGQLLIFGLMQEFGSLTWITVSVTRKLFTVVLSVFAFNHQLSTMQWLGIVSVFTGLGIDIIMAEIQKSNKLKENKDKKKE
mmetsp:Transcript_17442/g.17535  ORF Transcript_17442/g.17535 Transcript_17442/m.17535 type:complete len:344 (+) Transcript_17442:200-1231(+)